MESKFTLKRAEIKIYAEIFFAWCTKDATPDEAHEHAQKTVEIFRRVGALEAKENETNPMSDRLAEGFNIILQHAGGDAKNRRTTNEVLHEAMSAYAERRIDAEEFKSRLRLETTKSVRRVETGEEVWARPTCEQSPVDGETEEARAFRLKHLQARKESLQNVGDSEHGSAKCADTGLSTAISKLAAAAGKLDSAAAKMGSAGQPSIVGPAAQIHEMSVWSDVGKALAKLGIDLQKIGEEVQRKLSEGSKP